MIKRLLVITLFVFAFIGLEAQPYGNEWINYAQKYYKIKITQKGLYRIDSTTLANAGISGVDPRDFQIFNKGAQQYIHVQGELDGSFDGGDFIEFFAEKNDGSLDSLLYTNTAFLPNPYYSLINDTAVYFLTWDPSSITNNRLQLETDTTYFGSAIPPSTHIFKEEIQNFNIEYFYGETDQANSTDSRYTGSEGWFDGVFNLGGSNNYNIPTPNIYLPGPPARIRTVAIGASKDINLFGIGADDHHLRIMMNGVTSPYFVDTTFYGYKANRFIKDVPLGSLNDFAISGTPNTFQFQSIADAGFTSNRTTVSYIYVKYAHTLNLENKNNFTFYLPDNTSFAKSFLDITNFSAAGTIYLYDLTNSRRITVLPIGATYQTLVPNGGEKKCYITSDPFINMVTTLQPVSTSAFFTDYAASTVDSAFIIVTHKTLMTEANSYKNYRSMDFYGGNHNVVLADIDELYDQYAYGIVKSPLSIRGLCDRMMDLNPTAPPQNLFLIGKSIHMHDVRKSATNYANDLVPSFGYPSSDNLITVGLTPALFAPGVPTGRLAARTNADIDLYLDKIKDYENRFTNPPAEWMKQVLHFGGGNNLSEQLLLKGYLNSYKATIQDTLYGATVKDFFKTSTLPIEINSSDTLRDLINSGVSLMTFFGHASGTGFDQSIDDWSTYNPLPGHYPFLLANSCYSGDLHGTGMSSSESYTFIENSGVIGYVGSVGLGVPYALNYFSGQFYREITYGSYNESVGNCMKNAITTIQPYALFDTLVRGTCFEMTLHGDPSIKLNTHTKPDYKITGSDLWFDLISIPDSIKIFARRTNIGRATNDTIRDQLIHIQPNGDSLIYLHQSIGPHFRDTICFTIPIDPVNSTGMNKVVVDLDHFVFVDELDENNNTTGLINVLINGGTIVPVHPYEFAIIPKDTVTLRASTVDPFAPSRTYIFQIDTTDTFNSPLMESTSITSIGGVVSWKPPLNFLDTTVYYWRVSADSIDTTGYNWRESSFQHIMNKRGWEQAHFFQFENDGYQFTQFNRPARRFDFVNDLKTITCIDGVPEFLPYDQVVYKFNNHIQYVSSWTLPGITFAVFDPVSGNPWINNPGGDYGSVLGSYPDEAYDFIEYDSVNRAILRDFIINSIPVGHYVLAYTQAYHPWGVYTKPEQWENTLYEAFDSLGSSQIRNVPDSMAYIFFGRRGAPIGSAKEIYGTSLSSILQLDTTIQTNWTEGFIASPVIGPASSWDSLSWKQHTIDPGVTADSIVVRVIGIRANGTEATITNLTTSTYDVPNLGSLIDVDTFPRMRLVAFMKDVPLTTPPQLERWQVFYSPVPEAALHPPLGYNTNGPTLQEGQNLQIVMPIQNISEIPFTADSLLVTYWIEDANRVMHPLPSKLKKKPFNPAEVIFDSINVSTVGYPGANALWVEVNPEGETRSQLEQHHFNNVARIPFNVSMDHINPLLDVTFDGVHIMNNDIVSAKPNVLIKLKDENQFLALNDTSDFKVFVKAPSSITAVRIYFGTTMTFIPAVLPNNSCKINYTPLLTEDGVYQLIVQAKDKSDNQSGSIDYKINFEVINKSTITEVMNYPNPFTTSTRFVFTLTGSEVPSIFKIQIMTITGKVVKEIFQDELGSLHVGRNITDYAWDGRDEFGDRLANGVYLYHVVTQLNGGDIEKRETAADQYFKKGWGKMYLMR